MANVTEDSLYMMQIRASDELNQLLNHILKNGRINTDFMPTKKAPCVIYKEYIHGIDGLSPRPFERTVIYARTNHDGLQGDMTHTIDRRVLHLTNSGINDQNRGKILVAFCEIEFIIDILICYSYGVYSGQNTYEDIRSNYLDIGRSLETFDSKRASLLEKELITKEISNELKKIQQIRNKIAHNYFLDKNIIFSDKKIKQYGSLNKAIELKFNYAWFLVMKTYNEYQADILKWAYADRISLNHNENL